MRFYCTIKLKEDGCSYFIDELQRNSTYMLRPTICSTFLPFTSPTPSHHSPSVCFLIPFQIQPNRHGNTSSNPPSVTLCRCTTEASCSSPTNRTHVPRSVWMVSPSQFYLEVTFKSAHRQRLRLSVCLSQRAHLLRGRRAPLLWILVRKGWWCNGDFCFSNYLKRSRTCSLSLHAI